MSYEDIMGVGDLEEVTMIPVEDVVPFKKHPFKVKDDEKMEDLVESIRANGILTAVIVRKTEDDHYEMISGHRRLHAAMRVGLDTIPAVIKDMSDDESIVAMVDANIQREELLPSERAFAYRMKMEAMNRQGKRHDLTFGQNVQKWTHEEIGNDVGMSGRQVQRYIRLTELIPELLELVDMKRLQFTVAVDISYISKEIQKWIYEYIHDNGVIKQEQVSELRKYIEHNHVNREDFIKILNSSLRGRLPSKKVTLSEKKLYTYFPAYYTSDEMESVIINLLKEWKQRMEGE